MATKLTDAEIEGLRAGATKLDHHARWVHETYLVTIDTLRTALAATDALPASTRGEGA